MEKIEACLPDALRKRLEGKKTQTVDGETLADSTQSWIERQVEIFNSNEGSLTGYNCQICKNKGLVARVDERGVFVSGPCKCMKTRRAIKLLEKSNLQETIKHYSWQRWECPESWQREALRAAKEFAQRPAGWLLAFGNPGTGKTHLCTAICGDLLRAGIEVIYQPWQELAKRAKANITTEAYEEITRPTKTAEAVYLDDFLKVPKGKTPTYADIDLAFELLNARYCKPSLVTIISTEWTPTEILSMDEALGRRIVQRSKGRMLDLTEKANWSLKGDKS